MLADRFIQYLQFEKRFSKHTLTAYRKDLEQFVTYLDTIYGLSAPEEVAHLHIRSWMVDLVEKGLTSRSVNRKLSCLKTYFRFLQKAGVIRSSPMSKIVAPRTGKRLPAVVKEQSLMLLFDQVDFGTGFPGARDRLILELLYCTGMRRSELAGLRLADLDFPAGRIRVFGKGAKERLIPIARHLVEFMQSYLLERKDAFPELEQEVLLLNDKGSPAGVDFIYRKVKKYLSLVSTVDQRSPHVLRHSFATHLSNRGAELNAVKELLGHASLAATQVYMHNSIERLQQVYRRAHPKAEEPPEDQARF
jgi:integrase/recombinase XerC